MARGEDTLAFRHGPISAVHSQSLVVFFLSAIPETRRYEMDVIRQFAEPFKKIGARTAIITEVFLEGLPDVIQFVYGNKGKVGFQARMQVNIAVLFGQIFGMFASRHLGRAIDEPAGDSALYSRTVQGVKIYNT